ncbi:MAG: class I SAM-dependent methyltransferase [Flavitalea sp.]
MSLPFELKEIKLYGVRLAIPVEESVRDWYAGIPESQQKPDFPFWTRLWPSSLGMVEFLTENTSLVKGKKILEIGAGLGLPSFYAAMLESEILVSDYLDEAVELLEINRIASGNPLIRAAKIDWRELPENLNPEVLLLSDVNYEPEAFPFLLELINDFINRGVTIIISTPERMITASFLSMIEKFLERREVYEVEGKNIMVGVLSKEDF